MGFALVCFSTLKAKYTFNSEYPRMVDKGQVTKIEAHINTAGLQNEFPQHAMICLVDRKTIDTNSLSDGHVLEFEKLRFAQDWDEKDVEMEFLAGQHRYTWLVTCKFKDFLEHRKHLKAQLKSKGNDDVVMNRLAWVEKKLEECHWLVSFYDKGQGSHFGSTLILTTMT